MWQCDEWLFSTEILDILDGDLCALSGFSGKLLEIFDMFFVWQDSSNNGEQIRVQISVCESTDSCLGFATLSNQQDRSPRIDQKLYGELQSVFELPFQRGLLTFVASSIPVSKSTNLKSSRFTSS